MTEITKVLSIRLESKDKEELQKYLTRESAESILRQIKKGDIVITRKGVEFKGVYTKSGSVDTTSERISENAILESGVDNGVNTDCDNCPYINDLDMSKFDEVCDFKGIDRQKALDKCVQMLWR